MSQMKHVLKFTTIVDFFTQADEKRLIGRGENAVESGHIKSMRFDASLGLIQGQVFASMRKHAYDVEVNLDGAGTIQSTLCSCPRGQLCRRLSPRSLTCSIPSSGY